MNHGALSIFAKTSQLSAVKTRLAKSIGTLKAKNFYDLSIEVLQEISEKFNQQQNNINIYWALAEKNGLTHPKWQNKNTLWTGNGGLGDRLNTIYQYLINQYDFVIILGSDNPDISVELLNAIANQFQSKKNQTIIGPSEDGGFYFFASNQKIDKKIWLTVKYSQSNTLAQLTDQLEKFFIKYQIAQKSLDIDTLDDLVELKRMWKTKKKLLSSQKSLTIGSIKISFLRNNKVKLKFKKNND